MDQRQQRNKRPLVLVVDDDPFVADVLVSLFQDEGYAVTTANNGMSALHQIEQNPPDLVVADIKMPRMDGITLAQRIAARWDSIHVILMSAADRPTSIDVPFIQKPFDLDDVLRAIESSDQSSTN